MSLQAQRYKRRNTSVSQRRYAKGCTGKTRFRSLEHAKEAITRIRYISVMERPEGEPYKIPIRAYQCLNPNCAAWHVTSKES